MESFTYGKIQVFIIFFQQENVPRIPSLMFVSSFLNTSMWGSLLCRSKKNSGAFRISLKPYWEHKAQNKYANYKKFFEDFSKIPVAFTRMSFDFVKSN